MFDTSRTLAENLYLARKQTVQNCSHVGVVPASMFDISHTLKLLVVSVHFAKKKKNQCKIFYISQEQNNLINYNLFIMSTI